MGRAWNQADKYRELLLKSIPSEIVGVYLAASALVIGLDDPPGWLLWIIFGICTAATPFWLWLYQSAGQSRQALGVVQIVVASVAFVIWATTVPGAWTTIDAWKTAYGSALVIVYSGLIAPLVGMAHQKMSS